MIIIKVISTRNSVELVFKKHRGCPTDSRMYYFPDSWFPDPNEMVHPKELVKRFSIDMTPRQFTLELLFYIIIYQNQRDMLELSNEQFKIKIRELDAAVSSLFITIDI